MAGGGNYGGYVDASEFLARSNIPFAVRPKS